MSDPQGTGEGSPSAQPKGGTSGLAIASLVNGIVWIFAFGIFTLGSILALIFGYVALSQIKKGPSIRGRGMAIAGAGLGWMGVGMQLLVVVF
ncbi:MAG: DUF4190 domain-containing protein [Actinomycetota bacterium]|nr:DUF4190 domain-containing protein [Actinomycetota bacterium]